MKKLHAKIHPPLLQAPCSRFPHLCAPVGHERNRTVSPLLQAPYGRISAPFCPCANTDATALYRPCCKPRTAVFPRLFAPVRIRTQPHCIAFAASSVQPFFPRLCAPVRSRTRPHCIAFAASPVQPFPCLCAPVRARMQPHCITLCCKSLTAVFRASAPLCGNGRNRAAPVSRIFLRRYRNFSAPPLCRSGIARYICNILTF